MQSQFWKKHSLSHGGTLRAGKRKLARPLAAKRPIHVVLKSSRAKGDWDMRRQGDAVENAVESTAKRFRIRVHRFVNVGNHLHLAIQGASRREIQNFLRVLPQAIAYLITGTRKGNPIGKFWDSPVFTRVLEWGKAWEILKHYFERNRFEAAGAPRKMVDAFFRKYRIPI